MITLNEREKDELKRIIDLINKKELFRMGKLFNTNSNNYFYDTGTGKVIQLDDESAYIMSLWFDSEKLTLEEFLNNKYIEGKNLSELLSVCIQENLLSAIKTTTLTTAYKKKNIKSLINNNLEQLILELTGKCNLRCGYCIYNDDYDRSRNFNSEDMSEETAIKAVDYFFDHSRKDMAITFYGGEPLLRFELLKNVIEYSLEKNKKFNKELSFNFTTNMTMVTKEIAEYLAEVPGLSIVVSMDGPEIIHNSYRKFANGVGSFSAAFKGLKMLCEAFNKSSNDIPITINVVFAPPYTYEKLDEIDEFFNSLEFLPKDTSITTSYPVDGSIENEDKYLLKLAQNPKYRNSKFQEINPLWEWQTKKISKEDKIDPKSFEGSGMDQILRLISNRRITDKPNDLYGLNACCVPGARRLYVQTNGKFSPCERIGTCPDIGSIEEGINFDKIKKYYLDDYDKKSIDGCSNCWAIRLCGLCYAGRYTEEGLKFEESQCVGMRKVAERYLSYYHELLENDKDKLKIVEETELA